MYAPHRVKYSTALTEKAEFYWLISIPTQA